MVLAHEQIGVVGIDVPYVWILVHPNFLLKKPKMIEIHKKIHF